MLKVLIGSNNNHGLEIINQYSASILPGLSAFSINQARLRPAVVNGGLIKIISQVSKFNLRFIARHETWQP